MTEWRARQRQQSSRSFHNFWTNGVWCEDFIKRTHTMQELWFDRFAAMTYQPLYVNFPITNKVEIIKFWFRFYDKPKKSCQMKVCGLWCLHLGGRTPEFIQGLEVKTPVHSLINWNTWAKELLDSFHLNRFTVEFYQFFLCSTLVTRRKTSFSTFCFAII